MPEPMLSEIVKIRSNRLRAIRLEDDLLNEKLLGGYTLTAQALLALERIADGLTNHAKAWTVTGPYGSGKSFFGLFLANLLDNQLSDHAVAWNKVKEANPAIARLLHEAVGKNRRFETVAVTGSRSSLQQCLARGFFQVIEAKGFPQYLKDDLDKLGKADSRIFIEWIKKFTETAAKLRPGTSGTLIIFDEMGKALEYAAFHPQESDLYLLQELAEFASQSNEHPLVFIGILHQSFEGYAALLDRATQREWAKVQGRFEDIPFQEPPIQQMRLLANAIVSEESRIYSDLTLSEEVLRDWCPATMSAEEFETLSRKVFPLHPSVFVSLPYIFRRLAQNERSLFVYLSSLEPFGFQEFLATHSIGEILCLPYIFDYIVANYQSLIYATGRARTISETLERLENTPFLKKIEQDLLKTIGLLCWLGEISPLQARERLILSALTEIYDENELRDTLKSLQRRSLIVYRRFNETYAIWQGSDVNIEERLQAARAALETTLSVAEVLQKHLPPRPLLARRHSYMTGAHRYFDVRYVDIHNREIVSLSPSASASGVVLLCLPGSLGEVEIFERWVHDYDLTSRSNLVAGVAGRAIRLKEMAQELCSLHWVYENTPELRDDPVARREWRTRLAAIEHTIRGELDEAFNLYQISALRSCQWFYGGQDVSHKVRHGLSSLLSEICERLYPASPRLWNELLNRRDLTSQAAAARRALIEGILTRAEKPLLGIQKFPPERSMYETLLRRGGLHQQSGDTWSIVPPPEDDPLNLRPVWDATKEFIFGGLPEPRPLTDLYTRLYAPPFGVTAGLAPVLLAIFYKFYQNEITIYREGTLLVEPTIADWEVLLRRPELFAIAGCRVTGFRAAVIERMARGLQVQPYVMPVVRSLISRLKALPEYAWRTRKLPEYALKLRRAVDTARSPERFLFVELPEALGMPPFDAEEFDPSRFDLFFERLNQSLDALAHATPRLMTWARDTWLIACGLTPDETGWEQFRKLSIELARRISHPHLLPLLKRITEASDSRTALESLLALITNRPLRTWNDLDADRFEAQAAYLGNLWRTEANIALNFELPPDLQARSQKVADEVLAYLQNIETDRKVMEAALFNLIDRLRELARIEE